MFFRIDVLQARPYQSGVHAIYNRLKALQNTIKYCNDFLAPDYRLIAIKNGVERIKNIQDKFCRLLISIAVLIAPDIVYL